MAMTLRLTDEEAAALRRQAEVEDRSMHDVARGAIEEYIDRRSRRVMVDRAMDDVLERYPETLRRLGE